MPARVQRSLQALILAGLGVFLLQKIWSGTLYWYINDRFFPLVFGAALGLLLLASMVLPAWRAAPAASAPEHHHEHAGAHDHDHGHQHTTPVWRLWLLALPLLLGLIIPARPLMSSALANKGLNAGAPLAAADGASGAQVSVPPTERTVLDWVRAFNYADDPGAFTGQPADVVGFVYHDSSLSEGEFLVSRFTVTCCAADATGIGMRVQWPTAAGLEGNGWVRVRGPVQPGTYNGRPIPVIVAESVEGVAAPAQPYLYP